MWIPVVAEKVEAGLCGMCPGLSIDYTKRRTYFGCNFLTGIPHKNLNVVSPVFS
jgi:hypothetical protein